MLIARSQALSLGLHGALIALLLLAATRPIRTPLPTSAPAHVTPLRLFHPHQSVDSRSGGSNQTLPPAKHGSPPPTAHRTFIPPTSTPHPQLALPITIAFDIPTISSSPDIGD